MGTSEHFPRQFGKYVLLKSLARGGMGEIYLAAAGQTGGLNKLCVIKKVITEKTDPAKVNRFLDEAKVVLRLSHANLVSTFDAGDVSGELFIAMELVEGKDLREIWNRCVRTRTRIPVDVALVVVREIARALAYVHTYGGLRLVHRDVAPPNILLSYFGEVKLTDFGLARSILKQEHTAPGVVFGRASYLAPEQARGEVADARTDVYSLGIVLWELLTGQPYLQLAGLDPVTSLSLVRNPKAQPPSSRAPWISPDLDEVVMKALAAERDVRFQSAEDLRRALAEVMTRVAPRADSERVAEFLRALYRDLLLEESAERERLLSETLPRYRGDPIPDSNTPRTGVVSPVGDVAFMNDDATAVGNAPSEAAMLPLAEVPKESLHVSALRARADSQQRRAVADDGGGGGDGPTKIWRKSRTLRGDDAAQTFVGRVVDNRYRIRQRIGEGGMGTVYAAEHVEIGKHVAVKILHRVFLGEEQLVERFRREARAASRVGHPHIIEVTDFGTTEEGCAYFVMELLDGLDLADVLVAEGRLDPARAVRIAIQICQALEAAHQAGIIHRDLKPENIFLVARDGQPDFVKVLDFGIARNLAGESQRLTNPGMAMGTPEYMAPEQAQGKPADTRTDVYALGALLHEMVMGVAPFQAETQQEMLDAKRRPLESLRRSRPDLSTALDAAITRSLAPDPERRPQTMKQFEYELAKIAWGRPQAVADLLGLRNEAGEGSDPSEEQEEPRAHAAPPEPSRTEPAWAGRAAPEVAAPGATAASRSASESYDVSMTPPPVDAADWLATPPPLAAEGAEEGDDKTQNARDLEKLIEADLSPPPALIPAPTPTASRLAMREPAQAGNQTLLGMGLRPSAVALAEPIMLSLRPRRTGARRAVMLGLLAAIGAAVALVATNRLPELVRPWLGGSSAGRRDRGPRIIPTSAARAPAIVAPASAPIVVRALSSASAGAPTATPVLLPATAATVSMPTPRGGPQIVQTPPLERARTALAAGAPDDAVAVLRPVVAKGLLSAKPLLADALVASGWKDVKVYHWNSAGRKAREALDLLGATEPSHGAHALLGEALYAQQNFSAALAEFTKALGESPRDARLKRRVIRSRRQVHRPTDGTAVPTKDKGDSESATGEPAAEE